MSEKTRVGPMVGASSCYGTGNFASRLALYALAGAAALATVLCAGRAAWSADVDLRAHVNLTDGERASASASDTKWVTFFVGASSLPKTNYAAGEFNFWGTNAPHSYAPQTFPTQWQLLKDANITGLRYDILWNGVQQNGPSETNFNWLGLEDGVDLVTGAGGTVTAVMGSTPAWANGMRDPVYPPNLPVFDEAGQFNGDQLALQHQNVIFSNQDVMPTVIAPDNYTTTRYSDEIISTSHWITDQPRVQHWPIKVGTEQVWVDEKDGNGFQLWTRVDNILNSPDDAHVYQIETDGRVKFRNNVYYYNHGRTPLGATIKISYDSIDNPYVYDQDYGFDNLTGVVTRMSGTLTGAIAREDFNSSSLDPKWQWMDAPAGWDIDTTTAGSLHVPISSPDGQSPGHFLYQSVDGSGSFSASMRLANSPGPNAGNWQSGIMIYKDPDNWLRFGLTGDAGRPYLVQNVNGTKTTIGGSGQYGFLVQTPIYITVRKKGNSISFFASGYSPDRPDNGVTYSVEQTLDFPLKVGISSTGSAPGGVDVDWFKLNPPQIAANAQVKAFYNYLNPQPFQDYLTLMVGHFKNRIKYWEIQNEPDQGWAFQGGINIYSVYLKAAYQAIKAADPDAQVMNGGFADSGVWQLGRVYDTIGPDYFDLAAWHPYSFSNQSPDALDWAYGPTRSNAVGRNIMLTNGDADKEVFFGELAVGSGILEGGGGLNDERQADYGARYLLYARRLGYVKALQYWPAIDLDDVGVREDWPFGSHEGIFYRTGDPKPFYYAYKNIARNKGILIDLGQYDSNSVLTPASGTYSIKQVIVGAQDRSRISSIRVLTSTTNTDSASKPAKVAARLIGQASTPPFVVTVNTASPNLKRERWTLQSLTPTTFSVTGSVSGSQGVATVDTDFTSSNGAVSFKIPYGGSAYVPADYFIFDTFVGDGYQERVVWNNPGLTGAGDIVIDLPSPVDARYVSLEFTKAVANQPYLLDEVQVINTSDENVALGRLYVADGYQDTFSANYAQMPDIHTAEALADGSKIALSGKSLYFKRGSFGYILEPNRVQGIRVQGNLSPVLQGAKVDLQGTLMTSSDGERYIQLDSIMQTGLSLVIPFTAKAWAVVRPNMEALFVSVFGKVRAGSITADSFIIDDGSTSAGLKISTNGAPAVSEGAYVIINGAAGLDASGRLVYQK